MKQTWKDRVNEIDKLDFSTIPVLKDKLNISNSRRSFLSKISKIKKLSDVLAKELPHIKIVHFDELENLKTVDLEEFFIIDFDGVSESSTDSSYSSSILDSLNAYPKEDWEN